MAWKPLVIREAINEYQTILFLDCGQELRNSIDPLKFLLNRDGYFNVAVSGNVRKGDVIDLLAPKLNIDPSFFSFKPVCSSHTIGFKHASGAFEMILLPMLQCAIDPTCWLLGFQGTVFSDVAAIIVSTMMYNNTCYTCNRDYDYYAYDNPKSLIESKELTESTETRNSLLFLRGKQEPKLYQNDLCTLKQ